MSKSVVLSLLIIALVLFSSCGGKSSPQPDLVGTAVKQTIESGDKRQEVSPAEIQKATYTPIPEKSLGEKILDAVPQSGYCPDRKTQNAITEFRRIMALGEALKADKPTEEANEGYSLFGEGPSSLPEEQRVEAVRVFEDMAKEFNSIEVPECLSLAKTLYLKSMEFMTQIYTDNSAEGKKDWLMRLMQAGSVATIAEDELVKIEACLPSCEKP